VKYATDDGGPSLILRIFLYVVRTYEYSAE